MVNDGICTFRRDFIIGATFLDEVATLIGFRGEGEGDGGSGCGGCGCGSDGCRCIPSREVPLPIP